MPASRHASAAGKRAETTAVVIAMTSSSPAAAIGNGAASARRAAGCVAGRVPRHSECRRTDSDLSAGAGAVIARAAI
jgi:hypothetical protein